MTPRTAVLACLLLLVLVARPGAVLPAVGDHTDPLTCPDVATPPVLDGVVSPGEYGESFVDPATGLALHMQHHDHNLSLALVSPGQGWVSVRLLTLSPTVEGDNLLVGYVDTDGRTTVHDLVDHGGEVHFDVEVGGTHDVPGAAGSRDEDGMVIELTVPLNSSDPNDHHFEPGGTYAFRLAYNATSSYPFDPSTAHTAAIPFVVGLPPLPPPADTVLHLQVGGDPAAGRPLVLYSLLATGEESPVAGRPVLLHQRTSFGWLLADEATTDRVGRAEHLLPSVPAGWIEFLAVFPGDEGHAPANVTLALVVPPALWLSPTDFGRLPVVLLVGAVVLSVWFTYAFVLLQIHRISRVGGRERRPGIGKPNKTR